MEKTALAFAEIKAKLGLIDLNSLAKTFFEQKIIHNLEYLRSPEKIEICDIYFHELYLTFKILQSRLRTPAINTLLFTFMDLKQSNNNNLNNKNILRKILDCMFYILNETKISVPLLRKQKSFKKHLGEKEDVLLYFNFMKKRITNFLNKRNKFFEKCNHKTQEFYFYLVNDFEGLIKKNLEKAHDNNCYQYGDFNIQDYFKSDAHFELKVFYNNRIEKKNFLKKTINEDLLVNKNIFEDKTEQIQALWLNKKKVEDFSFLNKKRFKCDYFNNGFYDRKNESDVFLNRIEAKEPCEKRLFSVNGNKITSIYNGNKK